MKKQSMAAAAGRLGITSQEYKAHSDSGEKYCYKCKAWKLKLDFGKSKNRWDGLNSMCKPCLKKDWHKRYKHHPKYVMTPDEKKVVMEKTKRNHVRKKKIENFGEEFADIDMRGKHSNNPKGSDNPRWNPGPLISSHGYVLKRVSPFCGNRIADQALAGKEGG